MNTKTILLIDAIILFLVGTSWVGSGVRNFIIKASLILMSIASVLRAFGLL